MTIRAEPIELRGSDGFMGQFNLAGFWRTVRKSDGRPHVFQTEAQAIDAARIEWCSRLRDKDRGGFPVKLRRAQHAARRGRLVAGD